MHQHQNERNGKKRAWKMGEEINSEKTCFSPIKGTFWMHSAHAQMLYMVQLTQKELNAHTTQHWQSSSPTTSKPRLTIGTNNNNNGAAIVTLDYSAHFTLYKYVLAFALRGVGQPQIRFDSGCFSVTIVISPAHSWNGYINRIMCGHRGFLDV